MNRHQRRAEAARAKRWHDLVVLPPGLDRGAIIARAMQMLAGAGDTCTGATVILPDGTSLYLPAADARAMRGAGGKQ